MQTKALHIILTSESNHSQYIFAENEHINSILKIKASHQYQPSGWISFREIVPDFCPVHDPQAHFLPVP